MSKDITNVKFGLALVLIGLVFGIGLGIGFGANEDVFKEYIAQGIAANPDVHDTKSQDKIWRYAQRAHFHATGIAAFSIGLLILITNSSLSTWLKKITSVLIGLGSLYPMGWLSMFLLAPSIGRDSAHSHIVTESFVYLGVGGLVIGLLILMANLFLGFFRE